MFSFFIFRGGDVLSFVTGFTSRTDATQALITAAADMASPVVSAYTGNTTVAGPDGVVGFVTVAGIL